MKWLRTLVVRMGQALATPFRPLPMIRAVLPDPSWVTWIAPLLVSPLIYWLQAVVQAFGYPHIDLVGAVLGPVVNAIVIVGTVLLAQACAWIAQRSAGAPRRGVTAELAICGLYGMSPVVVVALVYHALSGLDRWLGASNAVFRDGVAWLNTPLIDPPTVDLDAAYGDRAQWLSWVWSAAVTALALWRALPQVDAGIRWRFGLLWLVALGVMITWWWEPG